MSEMPMSETRIPPLQPRPRRPFPWGPVAIVALGILFLFLAVSVSFNVYFLAVARTSMRRAEEMKHAQRMAEDMRRQAELEAEKARAERLELALHENAMGQRLHKFDKDQKKFENAKQQEEFDHEAGAQQWGTLEGRVVFKGELPNIESLEEKIRRHADAEHVLKAPKDHLLDPAWRIDAKTKGVANVCVYLRRPPNGVLPIHPDDKIRKDAIVLDAPFCAYVPHMVAVYPEWFDGKDRGETGQKFVVKNSSPVVQNARMTGDANHNPGYNLAILKATEHTFSLRPQKLPVLVHCDVHPWMDAFVWVFDHPYFAITKADGTFTIPRVPAGMEVQVMAWHESQGWLFTKDGKTMTLKQGKNTVDFTISAK
jgi:hypothetical protein